LENGQTWNYTCGEETEQGSSVALALVRLAVRRPVIVRTATCPVTSRLHFHRQRGCVRIRRLAAAAAVSRILPKESSSIDPRESTVDRKMQEENRRNRAIENLVKSRRRPPVARSAPGCIIA
jgi:hypothetical protein